MRIIGFVLLVAALAQPAHAQNFSCSFGTRAACLDSGAKVCSSFSKCVDQNASCFDSYQCDYEGFTCKSNVTECVERNSDLVDEYNSLLGKHRDLTSEYDELVDEYNGLLEKHRDLASDYDELADLALNIERQLTEFKLCVDYADNLDGAKNCNYY